MTWKNETKMDEKPEKYKEFQQNSSNKKETKQQLHAPHKKKEINKAKEKKKSWNNTEMKS